MKVQVVNMAGEILKVFHGKNAKHEAIKYIQKNQLQRAWVRDVTSATLITDGS